MTRPPRHPPAPPEPWLASGEAVTVHPFQAMGHPVRRFIVDLVAGREETAGVIAESVQLHFGIGWSTVSHHLKVLHRAGLVRVRAIPPERLYRLDDDAIGRLQATVDQLKARWHDRTGGGFHCRYEPEEEPWPIRRARRRPRDEDEAIDRLLQESRQERDTVAAKIRENGVGLQQ